MGESEVKALVRRINADRHSNADLAELRRVLATEDGKHIRALSSDSVRGDIVSAIGNEGARIIARAEAERMRESLGRPTSGTEAELVEHVATCWLRLQITEKQVTAFNARGGSFVEGRYLDTKLDAAQKRFLRAVGLLERLRRYSPPIVQVNIAEQQIVQGVPVGKQNE